MGSEMCIRDSIRSYHNPFLLQKWQVVCPQTVASTATTVVERGVCAHVMHGRSRMTIDRRIRKCRDGARRVFTDQAGSAWGDRLKNPINCCEAAPALLCVPKHAGRCISKGVSWLFFAFLRRRLPAARDMRDRPGLRRRRGRCACCCYIFGGGGTAARGRCV